MTAAITTAEQNGLIKRRDPFWVESIDSFYYSREDIEELNIKINRSFEQNFLGKLEEETSPAGYIYRCDFVDDVETEIISSFIYDNRHELAMPLCRVHQKLREQFEKPRQRSNFFFITPNIHGVLMLIQSQIKGHSLSLKSYPHKDKELRFRELTEKDWEEYLRSLLDENSVLFSFKPEHNNL